MNLFPLVVTLATTLPTTNNQQQKERLGSPFGGKGGAKHQKGHARRERDNVGTAGKCVEPENLEQPENLFKPVSGASGIVDSF